ncbi:TRAP transporter large permease [Paenibacillus sp. IB182496]|uniref:TRAP transporter large permease n=1 Tax=Paenibacillus sabuli TaxID=2772509 RepID=A0A927GQE2_9BACL|nr:TRAP transporter large permease [Paenibacillus sabuli]MBD2843795.1 TRAP transporter large permease [Paenibacillus sabuli]
MIGFLFVLLLALLVIGVPIFVALILSTMLALLFFTDISPMMAVQRAFGGIDKFVLMSLPLFILSANAMDAGGLSGRIIAWAKALVGHLSGGLAMATQTASMMFGALSGSSPATVVAIGRILYPELIRQGYSRNFASGLIIQSGSVSLLIPPSITLILYATATNTSVGDLFMAGLGAGVVFGCGVLLYVYLYARMQKLPTAQRATARELGRATRSAWWALLVPVIIIGGIFSGTFTPTEAAGVAALYSILIGMFVYKEISLKGLYKLCLRSAVTSAQVMILIAGASSLSWILTIGQVPQTLSAFLTDNFSTALTFLLFLNLVLLVVGMFLDASIALIVVAPLVLPAALNLGIDPIHLGIVMVLNLAIGTFTPPFGLNIFVSNSVTGLTLRELLPGLMRFIAVSLVILVLITYVPSISLFLPGLG